MRKWIYLVFVLASTKPVNGQSIGEIIDSLRNELQAAQHDTSRTLLLAELSYRYYTIPDSSYQIARRGLALATAIDYKNGIAANHVAMAIYYSGIGDRLSANQYLLKALEWQKVHGTPFEQARTYLMLGYESYDQLGYVRATSYFRKALQFYELSENDHDVVLVLNNLGVVYTNLKQYDSALYFLNWGLTITRKNRSKEFEAVILGSIGELHLDNKAYDQAEQFIKASIEMNKDFDLKIQSINFLKLALIYKGKNQHNAAIRSANRSLSIAEQISDLGQIEKACMLLHEIYLEQKNYTRGIDYLKRAFVAHDSIYSIEKTRTLQRLTTSFEVKEKEAEIKILQQESALQQIGMQLQNNSLKRQRYILIGMIIVIALLGIFIAWYRMMNRIKHELEIERVRNHIAKDLHDDIGSTLSSIRIISKIGAQQTTIENSTRNFSLIENHSSKILSTMADIVWSINPNNDTMEKIVLYMKEFAAEILEPQNINYYFILPEGLERLNVNVTIRRNIFLIFKEAINNAAKYSECTKITTRISFAAGVLTLEITDNGSGFDFANVKLGNGLSNMKERASLIKGKLEIRSEIGNGTVISAFIPIT